MKSPKVTIRKYQGDDLYSWAVFVNGIPHITGLDRHSAQYERDRLKKQPIKLKRVLHDDKSVRSLIEKTYGDVYLDLVSGVLSRLADLLNEGTVKGVVGGGYGYYPMNKELARWRATDGSEFNANLLSVLVDYAGIVQLDIDPDTLVSQPWTLKRVLDQECIEEYILKGGERDDD